MTQQGEGSKRTGAIENLVFTYVSSVSLTESVDKKQARRLTGSSSLKKQMISSNVSNWVIGVKKKPRKH